MDSVSKINSYRDLIVWQKSLELVSEIYRLTPSFPHSEKHCIISQMNRAAVSVVVNIAEGWGRGSSKNFSMFLKISRGSLTELETLFCVAQKLLLIDKSVFEGFLYKISEIGRMLSSMIKKVIHRNQTQSQTKHNHG